MSDHPSWPRGLPLRLDGVTVRRNGTEILRKVDLTFEPGRRYVLVGASGSGKSTLLRLLNRLDDPDDGHLWAGETRLDRLPIRTVRSAVGLVFQAPRPLPGTLADNLAYPDLIRKRKAPDRSELASKLDEVGLGPDRLDRDASELSGGERQRLAIATALGADPEILALDEPTSALDPASARKIAELLARRAEGGLRTIVVTHHRGHARMLGDLAIRLDAGRVVDRGPTSDVLERADGLEDGEGIPETM